MQTRSSSTITAPDPSIEPAAATESKSSGVSTWSAVSTGTDEPPGMIAFSFRPSGIPPPKLVDQLAERSCPSAPRNCPPLTTLPDSEKSRVPEECWSGAPSFAYSAPPSSMIFGTVAIVSTLLIRLGDAYRPGERGERRLRSAAGRASPRATRAARSPHRRCTRPAPRWRTTVTPPSRSARPGLVERVAKDLERPEVLAADVDEHPVRLDRVGGDQTALDQPVRNLLDHLRGP